MSLETFPLVCFRSAMVITGRVALVLQLLVSQGFADISTQRLLRNSEAREMLLGKGGEIAPETMKMLSQSRNDTQLWICLVVKGKSDAVKNNIAQEPVMLGR